jgi:glycosyltransferase involved in cell wall biosynthesis
MTGGVFGGPMEAYAFSAPENVLRRYFVEKGHEVLAFSAGAQPPRNVTGDVFHAHHFGVAAYYLALSGKRPLVFTSHNPFLVSPFSVPESRLELKLQRHVLRSVDAIVALAEAEADQLAERFGIPRDRFTVIPNGLDLDHYSVPERRVPERIELLAVGQLQEYKGHSFLLRALATAVRAGYDVHLTIVSHGGDRRDETLALCQELDLRDRVSFEGPLSTPELVERYQRCDIFVQPSLAECFPVTVLEAMACGTPVIATDVGGVAEEVDDAGIVVPSANTDALAAAISRLASDPDERRALGAKARVRVERRYDGRLVADQHLDLYEDLARRRRGVTLGSQRTASLLLQLYARRAKVAQLVPERVRQRRTS